MTMVTLRLVAGTDVSCAQGKEMSVEPSGAFASRVEQKAREALRNLKLPGQEKTVGELRDVVSQSRKRSPPNARQRAMYARLEDLVHSAGIFLRDEQPDVRSWDRELRCVVGWPDELLAAHPEFEPYAFVLEDLVF